MYLYDCKCTILSVLSIIKLNFKNHFQKKKKSKKSICETLRFTFILTNSQQVPLIDITAFKPFQMEM